jgi:hypothetical protein
MRFSDMMGSGEDRALKSSDNDNAISDALAPYLDAPKPAETAVAVEAAVDAAVEASREAAAEAEGEPAAPAPRAHTVAAVFPVVPVPPEVIATPAPPAPPAPADRAPVATPDTTAAVIADFTPLSDDLLPRRRK